MENTALKMLTDTMKYEKTMIWISPVCDLFQISLQNQQRKIKKDPVLGKLWTNLSGDLGEIDKNGRILLTKKGFLRLILTIDPLTIPKDLQKKFATYQKFISDFLFGSVAEQENISLLNTRLLSLKSSYSEIGNKIRITQGKLTDALNQRNQYQIDFTENRQLNQ